MHKTTNFIIILATLLSLMACQKVTSHKQDIVEVNVLLTTITIDALKNQDFKQAQRSIKALILNSDNDAWSFIQSAIISLPKDLAIQVIDSSLKNETVKNSSSKLFGISKIYISYKNTEQALATVNKAIELDNNHIEARYWRARLLTVMKEYEKAASDYEFVVAKKPKNETYTGQYASFLQETKQFDKAQKILAKHQQTPDSLFKRIVFALQNKNNEIANSIYLTLKNMVVDSELEDHKNFLTAESAYWLEKFVESEVFYRKVTGGDHYLDARDMISLILYDNKQFDDSIEILHQLQNAEEKYAVKAYRLEAQINKQQGNTDMAIRTLSRSLQILSNNPELLYDRAMLYESQNKMAKLEKDLLQIIKDDPENYEALNALGYSFADHDMQLDKAYDYIQKAISLAPENPAIIDSMGWIQYKLGKYQEAENSFNSAIDKGIKDPELYVHLFHTLLKQEKFDEANELLIKAKQLFPDNPKISKLDSEKE